MCQISAILTAVLLMSLGVPHDMGYESKALDAHAIGGTSVLFSGTIGI